MKLRFVPIIFGLIFAEAAFAQNVFPTSGNAGIGTTSPNEPLEIGGTGRVFVGNGGGASRRGLLIDAVSGGTYVRLHPYNYGTSTSLDLLLTPYGGGKVGIGTLTPTAQLEVGTGIGNQGFKVGVNGNMANSNAEILNTLSVVGANAGTDTQVGAVAWNYYNAGSSPSWSGSLLKHFGTSMGGSVYGAPTANQGALIFQNVSNGVIASNGANLFVSPGGAISTTFLTNGNVGIGTTNPTQKLSVNGTVRAKEVIVDTGWSDYVFKPDYKLASLSEVEGAIKRDGHLPGIPSAAEVAEHGVSMGDMQSKLLAKVEELTLHLIDLKKENDQLKSRVAKLETSPQP